MLDLRSDPATERFDAELAAAEDDGRIDAQTAKVLRWWQRESLRTMIEHASVTLPPTMLALERSATGSERQVEVSAQSWARAEDHSDDLGTRDHAVASMATAGSVPSADADEDDAVPPPTDLSEHRRRLLVAGLTRVRP